MQPIRSLRANEPHHDVTYDKECDVTEEPHFHTVHVVSVRCFLMGCVFRCCAWCGCVSSRYVNNLQHNFDNFETNASKISKENEQLLFPNYVCNENEEGRASSFANLFYDHHCKKGTILTNSYDTERFL